MFINEWKEFLINLEELCRHRLSQPDRTQYEGLKAPLQKVIRDLQRAEAEAAVDFAIETANRNSDDQDLLELVEAEMKFFNSLIQSPSSRDDHGLLAMDNSQTADALGAGKTIKDSIEKLFELPRWLKRLLEILNELLSIIRGG